MQNTRRSSAAAPPNKKSPPERPQVIAGKYKLGEELGSGSFGAIFFASHIHSGQHVAVKLETAKAHKQRRSQLEIEYRLYRILQGHVGIPRIYWFGRESGCRALVMELLGPSLEDMFKKCKRLFSVKTVCLLALQMLNLVQYLHSRNLLHRDIKPANFVMGVGVNAPRVYVIDFGLSKKYINSAHAHVRYRIGKNLTGTPRYASINNHDGIEQSRRDDLESLGYVFLYFVRGSLPWQGLKAKNKIAKFQKIHHKKVQVSLDDLCSGLPSEFKAYLHYCRRLAFEESPDYTYLKGLFKHVMVEKGFKLDSKFDWMMTQEERMESKESKSRVPASQSTAKATHVAPPPHIAGGSGRGRPTSAQYAAGRLVYSHRNGHAFDRARSARPAMRRNDSIRGIRTKALAAANAREAYLAQNSRLQRQSHQHMHMRRSYQSAQQGHAQQGHAQPSQQHAQNKVQQTSEVHVPPPPQRSQSLHQSQSPQQKQQHQSVRRESSRGAINSASNTPRAPAVASSSPAASSTATVSMPSTAATRGTSAAPSRSAGGSSPAPTKKTFKLGERVVI